MALATIHSRALVGMDSHEVVVEVNVGRGMPGITLVGLPDVEVREARDRVRTALQNCGFNFPHDQRVTINLAPADLPKESGRFDLPIALGLICASNQVTPPKLAAYEIAGELSLSGGLRPIVGALAMAKAAQQVGRALILPQRSAQEAALLPQAEVYGATTLSEVFAHLNGSKTLTPAQPQFESASVTALVDLADVVGQQSAKRVLEVAAVGGHSLLFIGVPGVGKSMLAHCLTGLLPPMTSTEALDAAIIQSVSGQVLPLGQRPYREPHHSISSAALIGGGAHPRPGEISRADGGVLFLDELPEFSRQALEALREPLETGRITIARTAGQAEFPANFQLVAAMNPCPCGYLGHPKRACRCRPGDLQRYQQKLSGPLLDRIDLFCTMTSVPIAELNRQHSGTPSRVIQDRVSQARARSLARQGCVNAQLSAGQLKQLRVQIDDDAEQLLAQACDRLALSARAYHRCLRVAFTLADCAASERVRVGHIGEALQYRQAQYTPQG